MDPKEYRKIFRKAMSFIRDVEKVVSPYLGEKALGLTKEFEEAYQAEAESTEALQLEISQLTKGQSTFNAGGVPSERSRRMMLAFSKSRFGMQAYVCNNLVELGNMLDAARNEGAGRAVDRSKLEWFIFGECPKCDCVDISDSEGDVLEHVPRMRAKRIVEARRMLIAEICSVPTQCLSCCSAKEGGA